MHELVTRELPVVGSDLSTEPRRLRLLLGDRADEAPHIVGDVTELEALDRAVDGHGITNLIHLAALLVPLVRANPPLGAQVNVTGAPSMSSRSRRDGSWPPSSTRRRSPPRARRARSGPPRHAYGVFKRANESTAYVYHAERRLASVGLRPHTVYGVGRDQGTTSAPTTAMLAAAPGGAAPFQVAADIAHAFIAASVASPIGASVHNLPGQTVEISDLISMLGRVAPSADIDCPGVSGRDRQRVVASLAPDLEMTPLQDGVRLMIERFGERLSCESPDW